MRDIPPKKITMDMRPLFRKRRIRTQNNVSAYIGEFSCEGFGITVKATKRRVITDLSGVPNGFEMKPGYSFGISKVECLVSDLFLVDSFGGAIGSD